MVFDAQRAMLKGPDLFSRFAAKESKVTLANAGFPSKEQIIIFERASHKRALLIRQMAYHHVAQGQLSGEHYLITF